MVREILVGRWIAKWSQALEIASERRRVYLMATRLDNFASISDETSAVSNTISATRMQIPQSSSWTDSINHWALLIMSDDGLEEASLLCQLRVSSGWYIEYDVTEHHAVAQNIMENGRHIGFTMCSNNVIKEQARQVLNSMPNIYNVANNNCQTFCSRLFECIRQTTTTNDLLSGRRELPREASPTISKRRTIELVSSILAPAPKRNNAMMGSASVAPSPLNTTVLLLIDILSATVLYWSFWQLNTWLYCLVVIALALQGLYGNSGLLRGRHRSRLQDEGLRVFADEETKWAIDYLVPFVLFHSRASPP
ncbi:hypothetical protein BJ166DRAFT_237707 [Pestalotiopsis sp. NC0098]|nr:hypothetical protein BJ166DRAFT_237707 [Pestalotiopsis sp. NC0098]